MKTLIVISSCENSVAVKGCQLNVTVSHCNPFLATTFDGSNPNKCEGHTPFQSLIVLAWILTRLECKDFYVLIYTDTQLQTRS